MTYGTEGTTAPLVSWTAVPHFLEGIKEDFALFLNPF